MSKKKYINADVLKSDLNESERLCYIERIGVFDIINSQLIIDAKEVRHGKWMIKNNKIYWQDKDSSSYELAYVIEWTGQHFEIVEAVERMPMEDTDVIYKKLEQAQKENYTKNRELTQLKEEVSDLR